MGPRSSLVCVCTMVLSAIPVWAEDGQPTRVRGLDPTAVKVLEAARRGSPTVRALVARIEHSDLIVYVKFQPRFVLPRASTTILTAVPAARFVLVTITTLAGEADRLLLLGHELRHAVELADAPEVRDGKGMDVLYDRIGWRDRANVYESAEAQAAGIAVRDEMRGRAAPEGVMASARADRGSRTLQ